MSTSTLLLLSCGGALSVLAFALVIRAVRGQRDLLRFPLRGDAPLPVIGPHNALTEVLHGRLIVNPPRRDCNPRLAAHVEAHARLMHCLTTGQARRPGPAWVPLLIKAGQCAAAVAVVLTWALLLVLCCADEPRVP